MLNSSVAPLSSQDLRLYKELQSKRTAGDLTQIESEMLTLLDKFHLHAFRDELTGLYNRKMFQHDSRKRFTRTETDRSVLYVIDINDFRDFNTRFGHLGGDAVLVQVARRISSCLRDTDQAYRFAGDEFCIVAHNVSPRGARLLAHRIWRTVFESPFHIQSQRVPITVSVGYAEMVGGFRTSFMAADRALYVAKSNKSSKRPAVSGVMT